MPVPAWAGAGLLDIGGRIIDRAMGTSDMREQYKYQKEFAKHGLSWRVADARRAGLHPLAALGSTPMRYAPQRIGDSGIGGALSRMGQNMLQADSQGRALQNRILAAEAGLKELELKRAKDGVPGQPDLTTGIVTTYEPGTAGGVKWKPSELEMKQQPGHTPGYGPLFSFKEFGDGSLYPIISKDAADSVESDIGANVVVSLHRLGFYATAQHLYRTRNPDLWKLLDVFKPKRGNYGYDPIKGRWFPQRDKGALRAKYREHMMGPHIKKAREAGKVWRGSKRRSEWNWNRR